MRILALAWLVSIGAACAAEPYSARRTGDVVRLEDVASQTVVSIASAVGNNAFEMKVKGQNVLRWPFESVDAFKAAPRLSGIPFLGPWANRLDEQAFYANGRRYAFDMDLGNVRGAIPIHGFLATTDLWQVVEVKADGRAAWVTSRLEFFRQPQWMKQFPFAHTIQITYRLADGVLQVATRIENLSAEPMPLAIGFHPYFQLTDSPRDEWRLSVGARTEWVLASNKIPTGETRPIEQLFPNPNDIALTQLRPRPRVRRSRAGRLGPCRDDHGGKAAADRSGDGPTLSCGGDLRAQGHGREQRRLRVLRADGGHHRRPQPRAQGAVPGAAEHSARAGVAGELLGEADWILSSQKMDLEFRRV